MAAVVERRQLCARGLVIRGETADSSGGVLCSSPSLLYISYFFSANFTVSRSVARTAAGYIAHFSDRYFYCKSSAARDLVYIVRTGLLFLNFHRRASDIYIYIRGDRIVAAFRLFNEAGITLDMAIGRISALFTIAIFAAVCLVQVSLRCFFYLLFEIFIENFR